MFMLALMAKDGKEFDDGLSVLVIDERTIDQVRKSHRGSEDIIIISFKNKTAPVHLLYDRLYHMGDVLTYLDETLVGGDDLIAKVTELADKNIIKLVSMDSNGSNGVSIKIGVGSVTWLSLRYNEVFKAFVIVLRSSDMTHFDHKITEVIFKVIGADPLKFIIQLSKALKGELPSGLLPDRIDITHVS